MEKTEAVNRLKKAGYQVQFDSSVVTVLLEKRVNVNQEIKKLKSFLLEIGYDASFGIKQMKDDSVSEKEAVILQETENFFEQEVNFGKEEVTSQEAIEENTSKTEEIYEVGEQFSLEDFGIS